jgi:hypothetical protein
MLFIQYLIQLVGNFLFVFFIQKKKNAKKQKQVDEQGQEKLVEDDAAQNFHGSMHISHKYLLQLQRGDN